jgi:RNA polymerase sigma-70 factor, ECF subfamily
MSEVDDERLLQRARRGDEEAFSQLFARHQGALFRYAANMCGREAGDDVVQDTFLAVLRQTGRHDPPRGTEIGYLLGIAHHLVLKQLALRNDMASNEELDDDVVYKAVDQPTPLDDLTRTETIAAVRLVVQSLPSAYREVVVLCELQEMNYAAVAQIIQCPIGTVRSRLHRARTLLTPKLADTRVGLRRESEDAGFRTS